MPWPLDTGAKLRNYQLARALAPRIDVTLVAFGSDTSEGKLSEAYQRILTVPRDERYSLGNILRGALGRTPLPLLNYTTNDMREALGRLLTTERFDLIQVESIHLMNYLATLRAANAPPIICDWHNVESDLMRQYAERERNVARRAYARRTAQLMSEAEERALNEFDAHITVSKEDAERLRSINSAARIFVIENGVDTAYYAGEQSSEKNRILFVGSMDYHANIEGVTNFARDVWPAIREHNPQFRFTIVGRNPPPQIVELASIPAVEVTGSVADVRPFYREALIAVVPLNVGGGSRLKILEAMAAGVPVVSTRLGAEGLAVTDGENVLLADSSEQLVDAIGRLVRDADLRRKVIDVAYSLVRSRYEWSTLASKLHEHFRSLLSNDVNQK